LACGRLLSGYEDTRRKPRRHEIGARPLRFPGAADLIDWFGAWQSFHDAEILSLKLNRVGTSVLKVGTASSWTKHAIVSFLLYEIVTIHLDDFNHQNVIFDLRS